MGIVKRRGERETQPELNQSKMEEFARYGSRVMS
jgi:hypothetical protein